MRRNITIDTDYYKLTQHLGYPSGYTKVGGYGEDRVGAKYPFTSWFGNDMVIQDNFLTVPTNADIEEGRENAFLTFGTDKYFNAEVWKKVQKKGYIPVEIKALPEGMNVPVGNALFTYESTEKWFAKTTSALETLQMHSWYPSFISTRAKVIKERIRPLFEQTGTPELLEYVINDFGARGATWYDSAAVGGMAVLIHTRGSDNAIANRLLSDYYGFKGRAQSIYATEHSQALSFGPGEGEYRYVKHQLRSAPLNMKVAMVIDTYDSRNFMLNVVSDPEIVQLIKDRAQAGGATIFRPDSGVPIEQVEMVLEALAGIFGYTHNAKGYKVLRHSVSCIQGDGMTEDSIYQLYVDIIKNKWSADNLFVGSGGGLLQVDANRDQQRRAIKPSWGIIDDLEVNFQKKPQSDLSKLSKTGHLKVIPALNGGMMTISSVDNTSATFTGYVDLLRTVYKNGEVYNKNNFKDIIERSNMPFNQYFYK